MPEWALALAWANSSKRRPLPHALITEECGCPQAIATRQPTHMAHQEKQENAYPPRAPHMSGGEWGEHNAAAANTYGQK